MTKKKTAKKKTVDVLDFLPDEAFPLLFGHCIDFLNGLGYGINEKTSLEKKQEKICAEQKARGEVLTYTGWIDKERGRVAVRFELWRGSERIAKSRGIQFVPKEKSEADVKGEAG